VSAGGDGHRDGAVVRAAGAPPSWRLVAAGIHTLGTDAPARSLVVAGDRIVWVGADPRDGPPADHTVDVGDAWIMPAFVDAHVHATATGLAASGVDLTGAGSGAEVLERLRRHVARNGDPVVLGGPWDDFGWADGMPTAAQISAVAPGRTVVLTRVDAHSCVVDEHTLATLPLAALAGVERGADGEPTGYLREQASEAALTAARKKLTPSQLAAARARACGTAAALGIGSLHEMGHPGLSGLDDALQWAAGDWPIDVQVWWAELDADAGPQLGLRPGGDLFLDGSIGSHTAAVSTAYRDSNGHGELFHDDAAVTAFFTACSQAGRGAGVHVIGDRAIEQALRGLEAAAATVGIERVRACRHRLEHVELPTREQVRRMAALAVVASVQPAFDAAWGGAEGLYAARFGIPAARGSNPLAWFAEEGVALCFSSDSTVTPLDPWGTIVAAEHHRGGLGLGRLRAVRAHVGGGRYVAWQDDSGVLETGWRADLVVWDRDPIALEDPRSARCLATVVAGMSAHGDVVPEAADG
jgi:predicted amidohydrolase YtcJ